MAVKLKVVLGEKLLGWQVFVNKRPIYKFDEAFEAELDFLTAGDNELSVSVRGTGAKIDVSIDSGARLTEPGKTWPFTVSVPRNRTGADKGVMFRL